MSGHGTVAARVPRGSISAAGGAGLFAVAVAGMLAVAALTHGRYWTNEDLHIYDLYAHAFRHGDSLYGPVAGTRMPFSYTPFAAAVLTALTVLPAGLVPVVAAAGSLAALVAVIALVLPAGPGGGRRAGLVLASAALAVWTEPVQADLLLGQINLLLVLLIAVDVTRWRGGRWAGVGIGLAAGIKLTPALFAVHLLLTRQYRAALGAAGGFVASVLVGLVLDPSDSLWFWRGGFLQTGRIARIASPSFVSNQSLHALAVRLLARDGGAAVSLTWLALALPVGAGGLWVARAAQRRAEPALALACVGITSCLVSPVSWSHHWVWLVVAVVALLPHAAPAGRAVRPVATLGLAAAVLVIGAWPGAKNGAAQPTGLIWHQPWSSAPSGGRPEFGWTGMQVLLGNGYIWLGLLFLVAVGLLARRDPAGPRVAAGEVARAARDGRPATPAGAHRRAR